jgi:hypothetical protein
LDCEGPIGFARLGESADIRGGARAVICALACEAPSNSTLAAGSTTT